MITKVKFDYDIKKDIGNYLNSIYQCKRNKYGRDDLIERISRKIPRNVLKLIQESKNRDEAAKVVHNYLINDFLDESSTENTKQSLSKEWSKVEDLFFKKMEKFYEKPIYFKKITAYFTSLPICPYNFKENWFMVSFLRSREQQILTVCHELMHFMFIKYYRNYCLQKGLSKEQFEDLKESLTVFLNTEFKGIVKVEDRGYLAHQKIREFLLKERKKTKNFQELLDKGIEFVKGE